MSTPSVPPTQREVPQPSADLVRLERQMKEGLDGYFGVPLREETSSDTAMQLVLPGAEVTRQFGFRDAPDLRVQVVQRYGFPQAEYIVWVGWNNLDEPSDASFQRIFRTNFSRHGERDFGGLVEATIAHFNAIKATLARVVGSASSTSVTEGGDSVRARFESTVAMDPEGDRFPSVEPETVSQVDGAVCAALQSIFGSESGLRVVEANNKLSYVRVPGALVARRFGLAAAPSLMVHGTFNPGDTTPSYYSVQIYPESMNPASQRFDAHPGHNPDRFFGGSVRANELQDLGSSFQAFFDSLQAGLDSMKAGDFTDRSRAPFSILKA